MRVLIMTDMEGVSGIVVWEQVNGGAPLYEESRRLYTEEINAAVRGARSAGRRRSSSSTATVRAAGGPSTHSCPICSIRTVTG
ncbi:MAG TPA: M55 family metallopeptidase [Herpetosiphonaceae bacterium]|nr:M55 family metallopeptidase [Herpetosiphonaceae bacterium]